MIRSKIYHNSKIGLAIWLITVMLVNTGYQYLDLSSKDTIPIEICDHTDSETECDKKELGEADDLISHDSRNLHFFPGPVSLKGNNATLNYPPRHLEIVSPPPESFPL